MEMNKVTLKTLNFRSAKIYVPKDLENLFIPDLTLVVLNESDPFAMTSYLKQPILIHDVIDNYDHFLSPVIQSLSGNQNHETTWTIVKSDKSPSFEKLYDRINSKNTAYKGSFQLDCHHLQHISSRIFTIKYLLSLPYTTILQPMIHYINNNLSSEALSGKCHAFIILFIYVKKEQQQQQQQEERETEIIKPPLIRGGGIVETLEEIGLTKYTDAMLHNGYANFNFIATTFTQPQLLLMFVLCGFEPNDRLKFSAMCLHFVEQQFL